MSYINYASTVWSQAAPCHLQKLQSLHKRGVKLINTNKNLPFSDSLAEHNILSLEKQLKYNIAVHVFKIKHDLSPQFLKSLLTPSYSRYHPENLQVPQPRISIYQGSLSFVGPMTWNAWPFENMQNLVII